MNARIIRDIRDIRSSKRTSYLENRNRVCILFSDLNVNIQKLDALLQRHLLVSYAIYGVKCHLGP